MQKIYRYILPAISASTEFGSSDPVHNSMCLTLLAYVHSIPIQISVFVFMCVIQWCCWLPSLAWVGEKWWMSTDRWWNENDREGIKVFGAKLVTVPFCTPQIPHQKLRSHKWNQFRCYEHCCGRKYASLQQTNENAIRWMTTIRLTLFLRRVWSVLLPQSPAAHPRHINLVLRQISAMRQCRAETRPP